MLERNDWLRLKWNDMLNNKCNKHAKQLSWWLMWNDHEGFRIDPDFLFWLISIHLMDDVAHLCFLASSSSGRIFPTTLPRSATFPEWTLLWQPLLSLLQSPIPGFFVHNKSGDGYSSKQVFQQCIKQHELDFHLQYLTSLFPYSLNPGFIEAELHIPVEAQMKSAYCVLSEWLMSIIHVVAVPKITVSAPAVLPFTFHGLRDCAPSQNILLSSCEAPGM